MAQMAWTFPAGQIHQEVTSVTLVNNTAKTIDTTVPSGKLWMLTNIRATNPDDVARFIGFVIYKEAGKTNLVDYVDRQTHSAGTFQQAPDRIFTGRAYSGLQFPRPLEAGNTISVTWETGGVSAGGTDADGLVIEYQEVAVSA